MLINQQLQSGWEKIKSKISNYLSILSGAQSENNDKSSQKIVSLRPRNDVNFYRDNSDVYRPLYFVPMDFYASSLDEEERRRLNDLSTEDIIESIEPVGSDDDFSNYLYHEYNESPYDSLDDDTLDHDRDRDRDRDHALNAQNCQDEYCDGFEQYLDTHFTTAPDEFTIRQHPLPMQRNQLGRSHSSAQQIPTAHAASHSSATLSSNVKKGR